MGNTIPQILEGSELQYTLVFVQDGDDVYWAEALPGSETTDEVWRANKYENSTGRILFADGDSNFDNKSDDLTNLSYS